MNKISRNEPCPCGSGKKYKRCCIDKISPFPGNSSFEGDELKTSGQLLELVKKEFADKKIGSIEEANLHLSGIMKNYNTLPKSPFLGLSPDQMHKVLNGPFSLNNELFSIEHLNASELQKVPLFRHAVFLMDKLKSDGEIKATQTGNLPRALVREMYYEFFTNERYASLPNSENDLLALTTIKHVLSIAGLIKVRANKFSLTRKGVDLFQHSKYPELFQEVFLAFLSKWNWAYGDRYSELHFIQRSVIFNFYLLHKKCQNWILDKDLGQYYLNAFPALVNEAKGYLGPGEEVMSSFIFRFLYKVCLPLGLLEMKEEEGERPYDRKEYYRVTPLFKECFKFRST